MIPDEPFDIAVIGAGVVGCAVFRAFVLAGARCVLLERAADILEGASKANSAILHTGFDATPGTLEAACVREGARLYRSLHVGLNLPLLPTGALVVAWTEADEAALPAIVSRARTNAVPARLLDAAALRGLEPELAPDARAAVLIEEEAVIDPWSAPLGYALQAIANGGTIRLGARVTGGTMRGDAWHLDVADADPVRARVVVNCAGLHGDLVEAIARPAPFAIRPRKGQFVVFDKPAHDLVTHIVLPVPNERTKGVVITRTAFGNLLVGPTAEDQDDRDIAALDQATLEDLVAAGARMLPALAREQPIAAYAGLRPATQWKDYQIEALATRRWITVSGIRSTGLTGALGIAAHVIGLHAARFGAFVPLSDPVWPAVPNLAESRPRPYASPGRSDIVCHCEQVTAAEIDAAFAGPVPAGTLGGLRRRTRVMNGRCQGFYCTRRVIELAGDRLPGLVQTLPVAA